MSKKKSDYLSYNEKFFKFWAPVYDGIEYVVGGFRTKVYDLTEAEPEHKILDVATGTGSIAVEFAKRNHHITGIDISKDMLRQAKKKKKYNINFIEGDARELPFEDNSFDRVTISFALHDMPIEVQTQVVTEMRRVVKPDGKVVLADYDLPKRNPAKTLGKWFILSYETKFLKPFLKNDFEKLITDTGLKIQKKVRIINGLGRIMVCSKS